MQKFIKKIYFIIAAALIAAFLLFFISNKKVVKKFDYKSVSIVIGEEQKLLVTLPKCNKSDSGKRFVTARGAWRLSGEEVFLDCVDNERSLGFIAISQIKKNGVALIMSKSTNRRVIESNDRYKLYRYGWGGVDSYEAMSFSGFDGELVYVSYPIDEPMVLTFHRNISGWFEVEWHIRAAHASPEELFAIDKSVSMYARKLVGSKR